MNQLSLNWAPKEDMLPKSCLKLNCLLVLTVQRSNHSFIGIHPEQTLNSQELYDRQQTFHWNHPETVDAFFFFFETGLVQDEVQCMITAPGLKGSFCLTLPSRQDHRSQPMVFFAEIRVLLWCPGQSWTPGHKVILPKCRDCRLEPPLPASIHFWVGNFSL